MLTTAGLAALAFRIENARHPRPSARSALANAPAEVGGGGNGWAAFRASAGLTPSQQSQINEALVAYRARLAGSRPDVIAARIELQLRVEFLLTPTQRAQFRRQVGGASPPPVGP
jgi:hypothetical protein